MALTSPTIADCMEANSRPAGFDYLRIVLALLIIADHSIVACLAEVGQKAVFSSAMRPIVVSLVPMFFALSGFLVASSLVRTASLTEFLGLRVIRIFPALEVDTLFCALILGVFLTQVPLHEYFFSRKFLVYMLNIVGDIHYELPGVFQTNPIKHVNVQLWTIPYELKCYLALTALAAIGLHRRRTLLLAATCLITVATSIYAFQHPLQVIDTWHLLVPSFLWGVCLYLFKDVVPWDSRLAIAAFVVGWLLLIGIGPLSTFAAIPLTYLTVWVGFFDPPRDPLIKSGDYSYPLYLYSFPIQQAIIVLFPWGGLWWLNLIVAIPASFVLAAFSWHWVEKPTQKYRFQILDRLLPQKLRSKRV